MLRITTQDHGRRTALELDHKLVGPWVNELDRVWYLAERAGSVRVILKKVGLIDDNGKELLGRMYRSGAALVAVGCLTEALLQDMIKKENAAWRGPAKEAVRDRSESVASWTRDLGYPQVVLAARR
jgi:hypothetical protein